MVTGLDQPSGVRLCTVGKVAKEGNVASGRQIHSQKCAKAFIVMIRKKKKKKNVKKRPKMQNDTKQI